MPAFFDDAFTEASADTELSLHTPGTGTGWTRLWSDNAHPRLSAIAATDTCKCSTTGNDSGVVYTANVTYPSANYEVQVTWTGGSAFSTRPLYLIARCQDIENMYALRLANVASGCRLYKKVSGTWTALGSAVTIATGSVIKISVNGTAIKVYDDGAEVISVTDSDISAAGKAGLGVGGGAELVTSTDDANGSCEWDSFSATNLSSGLSATIGQNTETDTAQALARSKAKAIGQNTETDLAQALTRIKQLLIGQNAEADSPQAFTARKVKTIGQVTETDIAQAFTTLGDIVGTANQVTETDTAQAFTARKVKVIAQVIETDTPQSILSIKRKSIGLVTETDFAQPFTETGAIVAVIGQVSEMDLAQQLFPLKRVSIVQVVEIDSVQSMRVVKIKAIGQVSEIDLAQAMSLGNEVTGFLRELHLYPRTTKLTLHPRTAELTLHKRSLKLNLKEVDV